MRRLLAALFGLTLITLAGSSCVLAAEPKGILWCYYTLPSDPLPSPQGAQFIALAKKYPNVPAIIVIRPNIQDGQTFLEQLAQPFQPAFNTAINQFLDAGIKVYLYLDSTIWIPDTATFISQVNHYHDLYPQVTGIFSDDYAADYSGGGGYAEGQTWPRKSVSFYNTVNAHIHSLGWKVIGNINTSVLNIDPTPYLTATNSADIWMILEANYVPTAAQFYNYVTKYPIDISKKELHLYNVTSAQVSDAQFYEWMQQLGWVLISEVNLGAGQYLPNWTERQFQLLSAINPPVTPTSTTRLNFKRGTSRIQITRGGQRVIVKR